MGAEAEIEHRNVPPSAKSIMADSAGEEVVLSFHDSLLRRSDVVLLQDCGWLNDRLIGFYFEYLEYVVFKDYAAKVCFVTPDVTQFIKLYEGRAELAVFLEPLCLEGKQLVVLAVNNNQSSDSAGGSHWSTLVYWRDRNVFEYYDSAGSMNSAPARLCVNKLIHFLQVDSTPTFECVNCPQQENSYDCGVYALMFAERVCRVKLMNEPVSLLASISSAAVTQHRVDILELIHSLA